MFNICMIVGLAALFGVIGGVSVVVLGLMAGGLMEIFGFDFKRVVRLVVILGAVGFGGWILIFLVSDPTSFTHVPKYDGFELFAAVLGAAVLVATYAFFGKKLLDQLRSLRAELEKRA